MKYNTLDQYSLEDCLECFNDAFSDYKQPTQFTLEQFQLINEIRGVDYSRSIGADDNGTLVGLIINAVRRWNNKLTAYDCGTGVRPQYREKGIAKEIFQACLQTMRDHGVTQYLLEVIQSNEKALNLYKKQGFEITREFDCIVGINPYFVPNPPKDSAELLQSPPPMPENVINHLKNAIDVDIHQISFEKLNSHELNALWDFPPSWQTSLDTVATRTDLYGCFEAQLDGKFVGYAIFSLRNGEIAQIAVSPNHRRKGVGTLLLNRIRKETKHRPRNFIFNIDTRNTSLLQFYNEYGFEPFEQQYEMILKI